MQEAAQLPIQLPVVEEARYDSEDVQASPKCHRNTRAKVRSQIRQWVNDPFAKAMLWLHAPAGTGKSTLARTLADDFAATGDLAAGYFFKRGDAERNRINRVFPTLASQFVETVPLFEQALRRSIRNSTMAALQKRSLEDQFKILLKNPLSELLPWTRERSAKLIIIDALDECEDLDKVDRALTLLSSLQTIKAVRIYALLTSRHEISISRSFVGLEDIGNKHKTLALHEKYRTETHHDIRNYLTDQLARIKKKHKIKQNPWPEAIDLDRIIDRATDPSPLFIYAFTFLRYIDDVKGRKNPVERMKTWISHRYKENTRLDEMYTQILDEIVDDDDGNYGDLLDILGLILHLAEPLPIKALPTLLKMPEYTMYHCLENLHSVLDVPQDENLPVELVHKSFSDYLIEGSTSGVRPFQINTPERHFKLAKSCVAQMPQPEGGLRKNICHVHDAAISNFGIEERRLEAHIPDDLAYASTYWTHHFWESRMPVDEYHISVFLERNFLHWVEILSLLKRLMRVDTAVKQLLDIVLVCTVLNPILTNQWTDIYQRFQTHGLNSPLISLLKDAQRFFLEHQWFLSRYPLHIYSSALLFSPRTSIIRQLFFDRADLGFVRRLRGLPVDWGPLFQVIRANSLIRTFTISPSGGLVAIFHNRSHEITIWKTTTGTRWRQFRLSNTIVAISFSKDGSSLLGVTSNGEVLNFDITTGSSRTFCKLSGVPKLISKAAILPQYSLVAMAREVLAFSTAMLYLWNMKTGSRSLTLTFNCPIHDFSFSFDGRTVAVLTRDCRVHVWQIETKTPQCTFVLPIGQRRIALLPNTTVLASSTLEQTLFWDLGSGSRLFTLETTDMEDLFFAIEFFPDGNKFAASDFDKLIIYKIPDWINQMRNKPTRPSSKNSSCTTYQSFNSQSLSNSTTNSGAQQSILDSDHNQIISLAALCPKERLVIAVLEDGFLSIWDVETSDLRLNVCANTKVG